MQNNKKGNIVIFNREIRSALQNSAFIEDIYSNSEDEENVSRNQWEQSDEMTANELSALVNFTSSNGNANATADYDDIDDNDAKSKSNEFANHSIIVIDDD